MQRGGSGQRLRLDGEIQILAIALFLSARGRFNSIFLSVFSSSRNPNPSCVHPSLPWLST